MPLCVCLCIFMCMYMYVQYIAFGTCNGTCFFSLLELFICIGNNCMCEHVSCKQQSTIHLHILHYVKEVSQDSQQLCGYSTSCSACIYVYKQAC